MKGDGRMKTKKLHLVDPEKVQDIQSLANELEKLNHQERANLLMAVQLSKFFEQVKRNDVAG